MKCTKAHGLGNDYIYAEASGPGVSREARWISHVCDRRSGIGADGVILLAQRSDGSVDMEMFNADGSKGLLCGNGLRAAALVAARWGWTQGANQMFYTGDGPKQATMVSMDASRQCAVVKVDMGLPRVASNPLGFSGKPRMEGGASTLQWHQVSMGNPHLVTFLAMHPEESAWRAWGPMASATASVPGGVNAGFAFMESPERIHLRVWERGSGPTMACGSGACAAFAVARSLGLAGQRAEIHLDGGILTLEEHSDGRLIMTGPAEVSYDGQISLTA